MSSIVVEEEVQEHRGEQNQDDLQSDERGTADFEVADFETDVPTFKNIAGILFGSQHDFIEQDYLEIFLTAVAYTLGQGHTPDWKDLASDYVDNDSRNDGSESVKRSRAGTINTGVSFSAIRTKINELMKESKIPEEHYVSKDKYRNGGGLSKYFNQTYKRNLKETAKPMKKFATIVSGFICHLFYAKEGYEMSFKYLQESVGKYISALGEQASKKYAIFKYRIVIPEALAFLFPCSTIDTDRELLRPFAIRNDGLDTVNASQGKQEIKTSRNQVPKRPIQVTAVKSYEERIHENNERIGKLETDLSNLHLQIQDIKSSISELQEENTNLTALAEQEQNNKAFLSNVRTAVANEESFKVLSDLVVSFVPTLVEAIENADKEEISSAIKLTLENLNKKGETTTQPSGSRSDCNILCHRSEDQEFAVDPILDDDDVGVPGNVVIPPGSPSFDGNNQQEHESTGNIETPEVGDDSGIPGNVIVQQVSGKNFKGSDDGSNLEDVITESDSVNKEAQDNPSKLDSSSSTVETFTDLLVIHEQAINKDVDNPPAALASEKTPNLRKRKGDDSGEKNRTRRPKTKREAKNRSKTRDSEAEDSDEERSPAANSMDLLRRQFPNAAAGIIRPNEFLKDKLAKLSELAKKQDGD